MRFEVNVVKLTIDGKQIEVPAGTAIIEAARGAGIQIPALCYLKEMGHISSCFLCVVQVNGSAQLSPSCSRKVEEGMNVVTNNETVTKARKACLELLLSEHLGDCLGPCQPGCPALIEIPKFIEEIRMGKMEEAIKTIKEHVALPAILGRICPEVCESVCRRRLVDKPIAICHLKRYAADEDLKKTSPYTPEMLPKSGKKVAIIGAGPTGLTAAYFLLRFGHDVVIIDSNEKTGGAMRYAISKDRLSDETIDKEVALIEKMGCKFEMKKRFGKDVKLADLQKEYGAVLIAIGAKEQNINEVVPEGIKVENKQIVAERRTFNTNIKGVFAAGDCLFVTNLTVRSSSAGRIAAKAIDQYLKGVEIIGEPRPFSSRMGKLSEQDIGLMMRGVNKDQRVLDMVDKVKVSGNPGEARPAFTKDQAHREAHRCIRCDCRKLRECKLRDFSIDYDANCDRYKGESRPFEQDISHDEIVYESGKCIMCGLCIRVTGDFKEKYGFTYIGRGFQVRTAVPFTRDVADGVKEAAIKCADICPTGAISIDRERGRDK